MSHEPGRDRHTIYRCEHCGRGGASPFTIFAPEDEYWCDACHDQANEEAYDRQQQSLMENGPGPTLAEQQAEAWKLK